MSNIRRHNSLATTSDNDRSDIVNGGGPVIRTSTKKIRRHSSVPIGGDEAVEQGHESRSRRQSLALGPEVERRDGDSLSTTSPHRTPVVLKVSDKRNKETMDYKETAAFGGSKRLDRLKRKAAEEAKKKAEEEENKKQRKKSFKKTRPLTEKFVILMGFPVGRTILNDPRAVDAANALRLKSKHLRRLKAKFDSIDIDGSGTIDIDEFFQALGEKRTAFTEKLFALIDEDRSGSIDFDEFVRMLATYCLFGREDVLRFCFKCFDVDGSGAIDEQEFIELCKSVNNSAPLFPNNFNKALEEFDANRDGLIDFTEFLEIDKRYPMVLYPAFRLQDYMQKKTLGDKTWLKLLEGHTKRAKLEKYKESHGGRVPPDPPVTALLKTVFPFLYYESTIRQGCAC